MIEKFAAAKTPAQKPSPWKVEHGTTLQFGLMRFEMLKLFIMDPSLDSVEVEAYFIERGPQHLSLKLQIVEISVRQAKEKSTGTWVEKPVRDTGGPPMVKNHGG